jgi:hypothetical protein
MKDIVRDREPYVSWLIEITDKEDDGNDQHLRVLDDAESCPTDKEEDDPW